jgi:hypothetical protein
MPATSSISTSPTASSPRPRKTSPSPKAQTEALKELQGLVSNSLRIASNVLASGDVEGARRLIEQKAGFRELEHRIIEQHFEQRTGGRGKSLRASAIFVDIIRDLHRINSHIVSAAYPIVDRAGLLRETRLRTEAKVGARLNRTFISRQPLRRPEMSPMAKASPMILSRVGVSGSAPEPVASSGPSARPPQPPGSRPADRACGS